ncbi:MAG: hypothetical protein WC180_06985 [Candidatus Paceibacterota bacterium]
MKDENLISLLKLNTEKMHFQQQVCFQIRNWAMVLTGAFITVIWTEKINLYPAVALHLFIIAIIVLILKRDLSWHGYFYIFCNRAKLIENLIFKKELETDWADKYFADMAHDAKYIPTESDYSSLNLFKEYVLKPENLYRFKNDYIEPYLLLILALSLIIGIISNQWNGNSPVSG